MKLSNFVSLHFEHIFRYVTTTLPHCTIAILVHSYSYFERKQKKACEESVRLRGYKYYVRAHNHQDILFK